MALPHKSISLRKIAGYGFSLFKLFSSDMRNDRPTTSKHFNNRTLSNQTGVAREWLIDCYNLARRNGTPANFNLWGEEKPQQIQRACSFDLACAFRRGRALQGFTSSALLHNTKFEPFDLLPLMM